MTSGMDVRGAYTLLQGAFTPQGAANDRDPAARGQLMPEPIAIIGMAGRFPGAADVDGFWRNLMDGRDCVTEIPADRWPLDGFYDPEPGRPERSISKWGGFIDGAAEFDPGFFGISAREADHIDPQQRLFLMEAWRALEDAGQAGPGLDGRDVGVFVGCAEGDYADLLRDAGRLHNSYAFMGNASAILAARIAYHLNLRGPALAVDTACSSALVALHLACESLRRGECAMAIAGASYIMATPRLYLLGSSAGMLSPTGRCRAFGADADGFVPAEAVGAVVLKPLAQAVRDGDRIRAVIEASHINQDGRTNGITAPSALSQAALQRALYERARIDPASIGYIETHGTGTKLGDPIEIEALTASFRRFTDATGFCRIGSVKSNIGHAQLAAGMAGLAKLVLALEHGAIPPTLYADETNAHLALDGSPFRIATKAEHWPLPRRGAISAFGFSGTNAHVVLRAADPAPVRGTARPPRSLFVLSGRNADDLARRRAALRQWIEENPAADPLDVAFTLMAGRAHFPHRAAVVATSLADLTARLEADAPAPETGDLADKAAQVLTLLPETLTAAGEGYDRALDFLARAYRAGAGVDAAWQRLWLDTAPRRIALPLTEFERSRHWITPEAPPVLVIAANDPLPEQHRIGGDVIVPGAAWITALLAVGKTAALEHIAFEHPAIRHAPGDIALTLQRDGTALGLQDRAGRTIVRAASAGPAAPLGIDVPGHDAGAEARAARLYERFAEAGFQYGPRLRGVVAASVAGDRARADIVIAGTPRFGAEVTAEALDAAFQCAALFAEEGAPLPRLVPRGIRRITLHAAPPERFHVALHARQVTAEAITVDIAASSPDGAPLFSVEGLAFAARSGAAHGLLALRPCWRDAVTVPRDLPELVISRIAPPVPGETRAQATARTLGVARDLLARLLPKLESGAPVQLAVIFRAGDAHAEALAGYWRSVAREFPQLAVLMLAHDGAGHAEGVAASLLPRAGVAEARLAAGRAQVLALEEITLPPAAPQALHGVHIVTGGTGALGRLVAGHLARNGAETVALVSRSARDGHEARVNGSRIIEIAADIADRAQLEAALCRIRAFGPVTGIIHAAGTAPDASAARTDDALCEAALAPKVDGLLNLMELTAGDPVTRIVLFGALAGRAGNAGQAAYACANRLMTALGRDDPRVTAIDWPLWAEGGMTIPPQLAERLEQGQGLVPMPSDAGLAALDAVLAAGERDILLAYGRTDALRRALCPPPEPAAAAPPPVANLAARTEAALLAAAARALHIDGAELDADSNLADFGFDSIAITGLCDDINRQLGIALNPALFFEKKTLGALAAHALKTWPGELARTFGAMGPSSLSHADEDAPRPHAPAQLAAAHPLPHAPIAIVGLDLRFPGAPDPETFWQNLREGVDAITEIPRERWDWRTAPEGTARWGGFIAGIDRFDAAFFGIAPAEADLMDPQQRLLLETVWRAIESAGYGPHALAGSRTGVFVGCAGYDYATVLRNAGANIEAMTPTGLAPSLLANRISFQFDFHGPSETVDTACSSSLVALDRAIRALRSDACEAAVVAASSAMLVPDLHVAFSRAGMLSPGGRCRSFDAKADGYVRGEGVAALYLKPLDRALADGDDVLATIRGSAVNHGGRATSLTAPSATAQAEVIVRAWEDAGVTPGDIGYIEAHGTGTALGDPVEMRGLALAAEQSGGDASCVVGTVKSQIGHLEAVAGLAGVIAAIHAVREGSIPANPHLTTPNPHIAADGPFKLAGRGTAWPKAGARRIAGVSSFGFGGANVHAVLERHPPRPQAGANDTEPRIIALSARNARDLQARIADLSGWLDARLAPLEENADGLTGPLRRAVADITGADVADIGDDDDFASLGLDEPGLRHVADAVARITGSRPPAGLISVDATLRGLVGGLHRQGSDPRTTLDPDHTITLADLAATLAARDAMTERLAFVVPDLATAAATLRALARCATPPVPVHRGRAAKGAAPEPGTDPESRARHWVAGGSLDREPPRQRLRLPPYRFQGERHWVRTAPQTGAHTILLDAVWREAGALPAGDILHFFAPQDAAGVAALITGLHRTIRDRLASGNTAPLVIGIAGDGELAAASAEAVAGLLGTWSAEDPRLTPSVVLHQGIALEASTASGSAPVQPAFYRHTGSHLERRALQVRASSAAAPDLPENPVCLILGGNGALGRWLAEHLAATRNARILRVGRSALDAADYMAADPSTPAGADAVIAEACARFGRIDAVFHLAGVLEDGLATDLTPERIGRVLAAKIGVLLEIDAALARHNLAPRLKCAFSSLAGWLANPGQGAYAAANRFLDGYALAGTGWRAIAWPLWQDGGMRPDAAALEILARDTGLDPIGNTGAAAALEQALSGAPFAAVVQGTADAPALRRLLAGPQAPRIETGGDLRAIAARLLCEALGTDATPPPEVALAEAGLNSLTAVRLVQAVRQQLGIGMGPGDLIRYPTIGALLDALAGAAPSAHATPQPAPAPEADDGATVQGQRLLWRQYRLDPEGYAYNMPVALKLPEHIGADRLAEAIAHLVSRHPALRQRFADDGTMLRRVAASAPVLDRARAPEDHAPHWLRDLARRPFRLEMEAPARFTWVEGLEDGPLLLAVFHHIAFDGLSLRRLLDDLEALLDGRDPAPAGPDFAAFVVAQRAWLESPEAEKDRAFWQDALEKPVRPLDLPTSARSGPRTRFEGATRTASVPAKTRQQLAQSLRQTGGSLFELALTAWVAVLARFGEGGIRLLVPTSGRGERFTGTVGHLVNPVVIEADISGNPALSALRQRIAAAASDAFAHAGWPFARVLAGSGHALDDLIHAGFYYQDWTGSTDLLRRLPLVFHEGELPLALEVVDEEGALALHLKHDPTRIDAETAGLLLARTAHLLERMAEGDDPVLEALNAPDRGETARIADWNAAAIRARAFEPVAETVASNARRDPSRTAVIAPDATLTYGELDARADAIAAELQKAGTRPGDIIAVELPRTALVPAAFLGVMRAGAAYLPLDPALPQERRDYMLRDSGAALRLVMGAGEGAGTLGIADIAPDDPDPVAIVPEMPAYLLYTSGSTGAPKGVRVNHGNLANFIASMAEVPGFAQDDRILALTPWSFDISGLELYLPLARGGSLVMVGGGEAQDATVIRHYLERPDITVAQATPATWRMALAAGWRGGPHLKRVLVGGEALPADLADTLAGLVPEVWNMYGPTETTIWSTTGRIRAGERVHAGHPVASTEIRIENGTGTSLGIGAPGEIVIGGAGVAHGYHGRPDLTAERFVLRDGRRFYRTGDMGRWLADGRIEIMGRIDSQIKLRGHRIEPGEIESAIMERLGDRDCAVVVRQRDGGLAELAAFVVPGGDDPDDASRHARLAAWLPPHMLPERWVRLAALPRTTSGKIDRKHLSAMPLDDVPAAPEPATAGAVLETLAAITAEVLKRPVADIDPATPIRRLGVDSLSVVEIAARGGEALGRPLRPTDFFNHPTLNDLARALGSEQPALARRIAAPAAHTAPASDVPADAIAVIGMAGRFPDAPDVETFWGNLLAGRVSPRAVPPGRWDPRDMPDGLPESAALISDIRGFDPAAFGMTAHEAACTDPQQRLVLMEARRALADAGYEPAEMTGARCGVFLGAAFGDYHRLMERAGEVNAFSMLGGSPSLIPARVAYHLDLKGPALAVDTACSASLVAVHQACTALKGGETDTALAGGVFLMTTPLAQVLSQRAGILSADGACRPFDATAGGIVIGEAVGMLLLKPLVRALADGDRIRGVIRATGVNQDGRTSGISAPAAPAQADLIREALERAQLDPASIGAIEAHGTGTKLGDPIELDALRQVFGGPRAVPVWLGSLKANIGHCYQAAGIAGLIKALLMVEQGLVPPQPGLNEPNPLLRLDESPFVLPRRPQAWSGAGPRRAGVSSFGFSGTNAHVVVEQPPETAPRRKPLSFTFNLVDCWVGEDAPQPEPDTLSPAPKTAAPVQKVQDNARAIIMAELVSVSGLKQADIGDDLLLEADLGMDSIKLMGLMARLAREGGTVPDSTRLNSITTVAELLAAAGEEKVAEEEPADTDDLPVLPAHHLFLLGHHLLGSSPLCSMLRLKGPLDTERLHTAWQHLVDANPGLRVTWHRAGEETVMGDYRARLHDRVKVPAIPLTDLTHLGKTQRETALREAFDAALNRDWDLARWPLHAFDLYRLGPDEHALFLMDEHVIADGIGNQLILRRLMETYAALETGAPLPQGITDAEYIRLLEQHAARPAPAQEPESDAAPFNWNPSGRPVSAARPRFRAEGVEVDAARTGALKQAATALGGTMNALLVLALARAAHKTMPEARPAIQVPTGARAGAGADASTIIGCFAQNLTLAADDTMLAAPWAKALPRAAGRIAEQLAIEQDAAAAHALARAIRDVPLQDGHVPDSLKPAFRARLRSNLYAPYIGKTGLRTRYGALRVAAYRAGTVNAAGTVDLLHEIFDGRLHAAWNYDANVFAADDIARLRAAFEAELDAAVEEALQHRDGWSWSGHPRPSSETNPVLHAALTAAGLAGADDLDSLQRIRVIAHLPESLRRDPDMRRRLLAAPDLAAMAEALEGGDTTLPHGEEHGTAARPEPRTTSDPVTLDGVIRPLDLILGQCRKRPEAEAVTGPDGALSYGELDEESARLAGLLQQQGVTAGSRVGVLMERGCGFVRTAIAVMRAGAAYVPIDPAYPRERMAYIAGHARLAALLTEPAHRAAADSIAGSIPVIDADHCWRDMAPARDLPLPDPGSAMVILYTSGTTGRPKGVELNHRGYGNRLAWHQRQFALQPGEGVLQKTSVCFDISVWELFWPLMYGGTVHALDAATVRDPWALADAMRTRRIAVAHFVPSMFGEFLNALAPDRPEPFPHLRWIVLSGEALPVPVVRRWFDLFDQPLANLYGPTEASIDVTCEVIERAPEDGALRVPIGRALPYVDLHVVDAELNPVADGATGELLIGGVQLANGYFDAPDLTEKAFVPFATPGGRAYRTGDLVRRLPDGRLDYLGRNDSQVKIRGHRIELSEIEAVLAGHPAVREAAVIVEETGGDKHMAAFVAASGVSETALRDHAAAHLPAYMIPHRIEIRGTLPKNHNGKLDRGALKDGAAIIRTGPLAPAQRWLLAHFPPPHSFWGYTRFSYAGPLDRDRLTASYRHLVRRHEALRTVFRPGPDGEPQQVVLAPDAADRATLDWLDAEGRTAEDVEADIAVRLNAGCAAFDLANGPLDWGLVVRHGPERHEFCLANHHINGDFVSGDTLFRDFWAIHDALAKGENLPPPPEDGGQIGLAEMLVRLERQGALEGDRAFWSKMTRVKDFRFAPDNPDAPNRDCDAALVEHELTVSMTRSLQNNARKQLGTGFYAILAAPLYRALAEAADSRHAIISHRMTGRTGVPGMEISGTAGNFAVHYPLRLKIGKRSAAELVARFQALLDRVPHGGVTYDWLAGRMPCGAYPDENLTPVRLNYLGVLPAGEHGPFTFAPVHHNQRFGPQDLLRSAQIELHAGLRNGRLWLRWTYPENRFARTRIEALAARHRELLEELARQCRKSLK